MPSTEAQKRASNNFRKKHTEKVKQTQRECNAKWRANNIDRVRLEERTRNKRIYHLKKQFLTLCKMYAVFE